MFLPNNFYLPPVPPPPPKSAAFWASYQLLKWRGFANWPNFQKRFYTCCKPCTEIKLRFGPNRQHSHGNILFVSHVDNPELLYKILLLWLVSHVVWCSIGRETNLFSLFHYNYFFAIKPYFVSCETSELLWPTHRVIRLHNFKMGCLRGEGEINHIPLKFCAWENEHMFTHLHFKITFSLLSVWS